MDQNQTLILDISSDDDSSAANNNFDWITKLLEDDDVDGGEEDVANFDISGGVVDNGGGGGFGNVDGDDDDSDDVVVVGEVIAKPPKRAKRPAPRYHHDDDDGDCVILESDPDKAPASSTEVKDSDGDSDELLIVGEKGQVACRDYPHSRHQCAKFPFRSTPHESYCDLCHCYVCDSLAPCAHWVTGVSGIPHCHATDKEEYWKHERTKVRQLKNAPVSTTRPPATSLSKIPRLQQSFARSNTALRPPPTYGVPSSFGIPNIISHGRNQRPSFATARSRFQTQLVSQQLRRCSSNTQSSRRSNLAPMVSSRPMFKRPGFTGRTGVANRSTYGSPNISVAHVQQLPSHPLARKAIEHNPINLTESSPHFDTNLGSCQPTISSISTGAVHSRFQGYSHTGGDRITSHYQGYGQPAATSGGSPYAYSSGNHTQEISSSYIPTITSNALNSAPQSSEHPIAVANTYGPSLRCSSAHQLSSISQSHQPSSASIQNFSSPVFPCNTSNSLNSVAQSYQQPSAENFHSQVQGAVPVHDFLPSTDQIPSQPPVSANSSTLDFDLDSWLPDNEPVLGAQEGSYYDMNNQPSLSAPVDPGMLYFDFETSWQGLAHS